MENLGRAAIRAELCSLYERAIRAFRSCLEILDRQQDAVRQGRRSHLDELAALERSAVRQGIAVERCIEALEPLLGGEGRGESWGALERLREEHRALRDLVLAGNRRNRSLLERELGDLRRALADLRSRSLRPSPFSALGEATLVDIRR